MSGEIKPVREEWERMRIMVRALAGSSQESDDRAVERLVDYWESTMMPMATRSQFEFLEELIEELGARLRGEAV